MKGLPLIFAAAEMPAPDSFSSIGWLLMAIGGLALTFNQIHELWQRAKDKPAASEVLTQAHALFARQSELERVEAKVDKADEAHAAFATESELQRVEGKVDLVESDLKEFQKQVSANGETRKNFIVGHVDQKVGDLQTQINDLPARIITILKTTGAIK